MVVGGNPAHRAWAQGIRGAAALFFGFLALFWPGMTLFVLVILFGAYALVDGVTALIGGIRTAEHHGRWWPLILEGIAGVAVGILTFLFPGMTALLLLFLIGWWAVITGVIEIVGGITTRFWLILFAGIVSVIFGAFILVFPSLGALSVISLIAAYAIVFGGILLVHAFHSSGLMAPHGPRNMAPPKPAA